MRNSIPTAALSEFVNEVSNTPEEGLMSYGIEIDWESGTRARTSTKPMLVGPHKVSRSFTWKADEPRQLMGNNHGPNPQELLLSGLGSCMMVAFVAGATAEGIQLESVKIDFDGSLDLRGFLGLGSNSTVGFPRSTTRSTSLGMARPSSLKRCTAKRSSTVLMPRRL